MGHKLFNLEGKIALITGSSQGLGFEIARGLGQVGATVILNGRNKDKLDKAVAILTREGLQVYGYSFDVTDKNQIEKQVFKIENKIGSIDILVNNAGIQKRGFLVELKESVWRDVINTNLNGVFLTSQQVVKGMIKRKSGKIINICSLLSEVARSTTGPYAASKGGVKMLTKTMAVEWAKYNIQANGIAPGYFATKMNRSLVEDTHFDAWIKSITPAGRWGNPLDLIGPAIFLASQASNFINGQIIYVDGGILSSL